MYRAPRLCRREQDSPAPQARAATSFSHSEYSSERWGSCRGRRVQIAIPIQTRTKLIMWTMLLSPRARPPPTKLSPKLKSIILRLERRSQARARGGRDRRPNQVRAAGLVLALALAPALRQSPQERRTLRHHAPGRRSPVAGRVEEGRQQQQQQQQQAGHHPPRHCRPQRVGGRWVGAAGRQAAGAPPPPLHVHPLHSRRPPF
jgi:hypothetical protein